jgi:hypothetical protein
MKKKEEGDVENYTNGYGRGFEVGYTHDSLCRDRPYC